MPGAACGNDSEAVCTVSILQKAHSGGGFAQGCSRLRPHEGADGVKTASCLPVRCYILELAWPALFLFLEISKVIMMCISIMAKGFSLQMSWFGPPSQMELHNPHC